MPQIIDTTTDIAIHIDCDPGKISDGYHTFDELYDHRVTLFIALCRTLCQDQLDTGAWRCVWRSKKHSDGSVMDGWFIMGIGEEAGHQITYHLPLDMWEETNFAWTLHKAPTFDGHTSHDVIDRLKKL